MTPHPSADGSIGNQTKSGREAAGSGVPAGAPASAAVTAGPWAYVAPGESIQSAVNAGARAVMLGDGEYPISAPLVLRAGVRLQGIGQRTRLRATATIPEVVAVGGGGAIDGVVINDLVVDADRRAAAGINLHIVGTTGNYQTEPDSVCRLDNLLVFDPVQDGVIYQGSDTQACVTTRVRVRRAGRYGFRIEAPDNWWHSCEATTSTQTGSSAGFYVASANNFLVACKAWYCRDYGFHLRCTRTKFVGCEAQDIRSHGWYIEWDKNAFTGCTADTCGFAGVGGVPGSADGFHLAHPGEFTSMVGCQAFDRRPGGIPAQQRYGFNVAASMVTGGRIAGTSGWDNVSGLMNQR